MSFELETAANRESLRRVAIDPVSRVEGHGKVTLLLDEAGHVREARLHIVEFRGFEKFIQGRPYWEVPVMVQRLCGICPVSHHLAAAKALDPVVGAMAITPTAEKIRRLMHYGQTLQSHAVHFFHLASPDFLFDFDDKVAHRNVVGVMADHPDIARQGVKLRKYGQEVIRCTAGKRVHGTGAIPGGVNKSLTLQERNQARLDRMMAQNPSRIDLYKRYQEIIADYNKDKDDAEIQRVFDDLMTLHDSLDQEEQRYIREGFKTEKELAVFDLLSKDKTSITKGDIDKIKKVAQELMDTVEQRRQEMGDLRDRASSQAQMKAAIIDRMLEGMPDEFSSEEIEARAEVIYQYVETQMQSAAVH